MLLTAACALASAILQILVAVAAESNPSSAVAVFTLFFVVMPRAATSAFALAAFALNLIGKGHGSTSFDLARAFLN